MIEGHRTGQEYQAGIINHHTVAIVFEMVEDIKVLMTSKTGSKFIFSLEFFLFMSL